jgi:hypothetical protein
MRKRILLTVPELEALREAVRSLPWLPMEPAAYRRARALSAKLDRALALAERRARAAQVVVAAGS